MLCRTHLLTLVTGLLVVSLPALGQATASAADSPGQPQASAGPSSGTSALPVFTTYEEAAQAGPGKMVELGDPAGAVVGYAFRPFKSRQQAVDSVIKKASSAGMQGLLVVFDGERTFDGSAPPPGNLMGGVYAVFAAIPVSYVDATPENLLGELRHHIFSPQTYTSTKQLAHVEALLARAEDPRFASIAPALKDLLRDPHSDGMPRAFGVSLVQAIVPHDGAGADEELMRWAKFHKNPGVRQAAMSLLVHDGHGQDVEAILANEADPQVKDAVSRQLL